MCLKVTEEDKNQKRVSFYIQKRKAEKLENEEDQDT